MAKRVNINWTEEVESSLAISFKRHPSDWEQILKTFLEMVENNASITDENKSIIRSKANKGTLSGKWTRIKDKYKNNVTVQQQWPPEVVNRLIAIYNIVSKETKTEAEVLKKVFEEFKIIYPNYKGTLDSIRLKISREIAKLPKVVPEPEYQINWDLELRTKLSNITADIRIEMGSLPQKKVVTKEDVYKKIHQRFCDENDLNPSIESIKGQIKSMNLLSRYDFGFDKEPEEPSESSGVNMPSTYDNMLKYYNFGLVFRTTPLFDAMCYRCGQLLSGCVNRGHKWIFPNDIREQDPIIPVEMMYTSEQLVKSLPYCDNDKQNFYSCLNCMNNQFSFLAEKFNTLSKSALKDQRLAPIERPEVIADLKNSYEIGSVSLVGFWSNTLEKRTYERNQYTIKYGTSRLSHKSDDHYYRVMNLMMTTGKYVGEEASDLKIRLALIWFKKNNDFYKAFYSHYETLFHYFHKEDPITIFGGIDYRKTNKVSKLKELIGDEKAILLIPSEDTVEDDEAMINSSDEDIAGISHPMSVETVNRSLAAIINGVWVKHSDFQIDAKAFPHLYPYGTGSHNKMNSKYLKFTLHNFAKFRLLNIDPRWRGDKNYSFHLLDRDIKKRIYDFQQNTIRTVNIKSALHRTSKAIKDEKNKPFYNKMGTRMPTRLPGSRTFWLNKYTNLITMVSSFGNPTFFVTLTQNDYSSEMQALFKKADEQFQATPHSMLSQGISAKGYPTVKFPAESVIHMHNYLRHFVDKFIKNENSPFGTNIAYFIRAEYQQRGAVHYHILLWSEPNSYNERSVVMAEMPRSEKDETGAYDSYTQTCRKLVKKFQTHKCVAACFKGKGKALKKRRKTKERKTCRHGFPFNLTNEEFMDTEGRRFNYIRREEEDIRVVSYNLELLVNGYRHHNVAKVGDRFPIDYIVKYVTKAERLANIKIPKKAGAVNRYLMRRVVGAPECAAILLQIPQCLQSHEVLYLPTTLDPKSRVIKRHTDLPKDDSSKDIYYKTLFEKYLYRNISLKDMTYKKYFETYRFIYEKNKRIEPRIKRKPVKSGNESSSNESSSEEDYWPDEEKPANRRRMPTITDQKKRKLRERMHPALIKTQYFYRVGPQQNKWLMQKLMLNVPWCGEQDMKYLRSIENNVPKLIEECVNHKLINENETGIDDLEEAERKGVPWRRICELVEILKDANLLTDKEIDDFKTKYDNKTLPPNNMDIEDDSDLGELEESDDENYRPPLVPVKTLDTYINGFTDSQRKTFEYISKNIESGVQVRLCVTGEAGVGKSFLIEGLIAYLQEKQSDLKFALLATTGVAANNIKGITAHRFLKLDPTRKCSLAYNTREGQDVMDTDVIILDEFSMMTRDFFDDFRYYMRRFCKAKYISGDYPFGGKHIIMFGDFAQLPAIGHQLYQSKFFGSDFRFVVLRDIIRQKDPGFIKILNKLRFLIFDNEVVDFIKERGHPYRNLNAISSQIKHFIEQRNGSSLPKDYEKLMILVPTLKEKKQYNSAILKHIDGEIFSNRHYREQKKKGELDPELPKEGILAKDTIRNTDNRPNQIEYNALRKLFKPSFQEVLQLKIGAKVMLLRNYSSQEGWVNGTLARVVRITELCVEISKLNDPNDTFSVMKDIESLKKFNVEITRCQFPLEVAYCMTIHKAQGLTISHDLFVVTGKVFKAAMPYVAFSRCVSPDNLHILNASDLDIEAMRKKSNYRSNVNIRNLLKWIDNVDIIGPKKQIPFPPELLAEYEYTVPEDRQGDKQFNAGEREPDGADELSDIDIDDDFIQAKHPLPVHDKDIHLPSDDEIDQFDSDGEDNEETQMYYSDEEKTQIYDVEMLSTPTKRESSKSPDTPRKTKKISDLTESVGKIMVCSQPKTREEKIRESKEEASHLQPKDFVKRAMDYLQNLIKSNAFDHNIEHLSTQFTEEMRGFAEAMLVKARSKGEVLYTNDFPIQTVRQKPILDQAYRTIQTTGDGDCFYHSVSIALFKHEKFTPVLRYLMIYKIVEYFEMTGNINPPKALEDSFQLSDGRSIRNKNLCDFALSCCLHSSLFNSRIFKFPKRIMDLRPDTSRLGTFNYSTLFHKYFMTTILERPILCHGVYPNEQAQALVSSLNCWNRPPVCVNFINGNHYSCLLPTNANIMRKVPILVHTTLLAQEEDQQFKEILHQCRNVQRNDINQVIIEVDLD